MGFFEDLFDFNGNGRVDAEDDLFLIYMMDIAQQQQQQGTYNPPAAPSPSPVSSTPATTEAERRKKLYKQFCDMSSEILLAPKYGTIEDKEKIKGTIAFYEYILGKAIALNPGKGDNLLYDAWQNVCKEAKRWIHTAMISYALLSGYLPQKLDTTGYSLSDLEDDLEQLEENEPEDCLSVEWDKWEERRRKLSDLIDALRYGK